MCEKFNNLKLSLTSSMTKIGMAGDNRSKSDVNVFLKSKKVPSEFPTVDLSCKRNDSLLHESFSKPRLPDRDSKRLDVFGRRRHYGSSLFSNGPNIEQQSQKALEQSVLEVEYDDDSETSSAPLTESKNMKRAIDATLNSESGSIRRSAMIHLAEDVFKPLKNKNDGEAMTFPTTMTSREAAAILETMCRDMLCEVKRISTGTACPNSLIKLKVCRPGRLWGPANTRRAKAYIWIQEYDPLRTDIYISRTNSALFFESSGFDSLANDIRWRFQREWPCDVDSLYIRVPILQNFPA